MKQMDADTRASHKCVSRAAALWSMPVCAGCSADLQRGDFSGTQLKVASARRRCKACVSARIDAQTDESVEEMHNCSPNMQAAFLALPPETVKELEAMAEEGLNAWQQRADDLEREAEFGADDGTYTMAPLHDERFTVLGWSRVHKEGTESEVCVVHDVMTPAQCDAILLAVQSRADVRGGWDKTRHRYYPTTDMRLVEACKDAPEVEQLIRQIVFEKICQPLATRWGGGASCPSTFQPSPQPSP